MSIRDPLRDIQYGQVDGKLNIFTTMDILWTYMLVYTGSNFFPLYFDVIIIFPRNVRFREYYVFVSNAAAAAAVWSAAWSATWFAASQFRCQRDNFWKDSSNLTHALFIQISRTSSIIDIVVPSRMAAGGHFVKKFQKTKIAYRSEMARNAIESDFRTSKWPPAGILSKIKKN